MLLVCGQAGPVGDSAAAAEPLPAADHEFFEKEIRPLLAKRCYSCHGADQQKGNLRLDTRGGWSTGGDSGPAIVPGEPDESLLVEAVRYDALQMPPSDRLPDAEIALLEQWVARGAPDPRDDELPAGPATLADTIEEGRRHWAYQLPTPAPAPDVGDTSWPRTDVDRFILARLEEHAIEPVSDADRQALVRRLYFDLTGLPPTPAEMDAFLRDPRPDAYERLVDQLLASPHFGERWGRHWLDVARFGESVTLRGFIFSQAWRYRDYVIDAFNADRSYARFVREQIAGDLLPAADWRDAHRQMVATTFLMLGNINFEEQDKKQLDMDVVDEQLDTIGKAFLAQTIGCARCHDHKFDPIPTRDYYAMAGILRGATAMEHENVSKWIELPLPVSPAEEARLKQHELAVAALESKIKSQKELVARLQPADAKAASPAIVAAGDLPGIVIDSSQAKAVGEWQLSQYFKRYVGDGYLHDINRDKGTKTLTFQAERLEAGRYEVRLAYVPGAGRAREVPVTILHADGETTVYVDQQPDPAVEGRFAVLGQFRFERSNQGYVMVSNEATSGHVTADAVQFLPLEMVAAAESDGAASDAQNEVAQEAQPGRAEKAKRAAKELKQLEQQLKRLTSEGPQRPKVMTVREEGHAADLPIHHRGSVHSLGEVVPRGFVQVATYETPRAIPADESGRRGLADWLASPSNPLTARVMVNRVWHWLFGAGLVSTTDNFGTTGDTPTHPELLDHLALQFMRHDWSVKELVREIVLSRTYRLSTQPNAAAEAIDPENRLLWRMNRRRLDAESIRDTLLVLSGTLDRSIGGPSFQENLSADYGFEYKGTRRSVYVPVFRNELPDLFEVFDFPDPSMVTGRRATSIVAPQALYLMNHPFVMQQTDEAARTLVAETEITDEERLDQVYLAVLGRSPTDAEQSLALDYLGQPTVGENSESERIETWSRVIQAVIASPEFRYLE